MDEIQCPEPGIYFDFPEDQYHKLPALGSSNIKDLLANPVLFWANSWMNPFKDQDEDEQDTTAKDIGSAYHKRILEGSDAFYRSYATSFDPSMYPDAVSSSDEIKQKLREFKQLGHDVKLTANKPFLIEQLLECDPEIEIMDAKKAEYEEIYEGMKFLDQKVIDRIEYAAAMIEKHPQLGKCFVGGCPEVTVIWQHPEFPHIMQKCRIDYLKLRAFVDLKTFANKFNKPTERAIYSEMANYKYHIQACYYWEGVEQAVRFAQKGQVFGDHDQEWIKKFSQAEDFDMFYVFQQKGIAPVARGKKFSRGSVYQCGMVAIQQAYEIYNENIKRFGCEQWVDITPITDFHDDEFYPWTVDL